MYLHIGEGHMIPEKDVVFIGNLENTTYSEITREFLNVSREEGFIVDYFSGKARSYVLTGETIYFSIISSTTLKKRMNDLIK